MCNLVMALLVLLLVGRLSVAHGDRPDCSGLGRADEPAREIRVGLGGAL